MNYSTQAMSRMWTQGYAQSQLISFGPQMSAMQTPGAYPRTLKTQSAMQTSGAHPRTLKSSSAMQTPGAYPRTPKSASAMQTPEAYPRTPKSKRSKHLKSKKVSFSNDDEYGAQEEPNAIFEDSFAAQGSEVSGNSEAEVIEDIAVTEEDGVL